MITVALVSPPWFSVQSPCVQLSTLKASIETFTNVKVDCYYPFLDVADAIGYNAYRDFQATFVGSIIGSALYYEEEPGFLPSGKTVNFLFEDLAPPPENESPRYRPLLEPIRDKKRFDAVIASVQSVLIETAHQLRKYDIIGFSNSYAQLFYSACIARELSKDEKRRSIIFGGSECHYKSAPGILSEFPEVDYVVTGEGEAALAGIIELNLTGRSEIYDTVKAAGGILDRGAIDRQFYAEFVSLLTADRLNSRGQLRSLNTLPQINYDDYLSKLGSLSISDQVRKSLIPLIETGRGCYWSKPINSDEHGRGCAFCGEKNLWINYRKKTPRRVASEIFEVVNKHELDTIYLSDSAISHAYGKEIFETLPKSMADTKFVMNIRADTPYSVLALYRSRSITHMTVGFEALSTGILTVMNKGTTAMQNIAVLKYVERLGINHDGVMISFHPGVEEAPIRDAIDNVEFARYYRPLATSRFHLLSTSPMRDRPESYGIKDVGNHEQYRGFMPARAFENLDLYRKTFRWSTDNQRDAWLQMEERTRLWASEYEALKSLSRLPLLYQHKGPGFTKVVKRGLTSGDRATEREYTIRGWKERVYLDCFEPRSLKEEFDGLERYGDVTASAFDLFIGSLIEEKLMYREGDQILALAVPLDGVGELRFFDFGD